MGGIFLGNSLLTHSSIENIIQDNDFYIKANGDNINWTDKEFCTLNISEPTNFTLNDILVAKQEYRDIILQIDNLDTNGVKITNYLVLESFNANSLINRFVNDNFIATINNDTTITIQQNIKMTSVDWNINDPKNPAYIKNRPFYEIPLENPLLIDNAVVNITPGYNNDQGIFSLILTLGYKYKVTYDGVEYITECYLSDWGFPIIGNQVWNGFGNVDSNEPFSIGGWADDPDHLVNIYIDNNNGGAHTISIEQLTKDIVKIDPKYLPSLVGKDVSTGEMNEHGLLHLGAEIFNNYASNQASGPYSHAEGSNTLAIGEYSHSEGQGTCAEGDNGSHAEGQSTYAFGDAAHTEGVRTQALGDASHAEGEYTYAEGFSSHTEGYRTTAKINDQHVQGRYNIPDEISAHIVGNGSSTGDSNAHTLDWNGNAWFAGDVHVGSTSGKNKDGGSKKLATEEYVDNAVANAGAGLPEHTSADNGKFLRIVNGAPAWATVQNIEEVEM